MSAKPPPSKLNSCGCCQTEQLPTLAANSPGRSALSYRIGTHASFFNRMLLHVHNQTVSDGHMPLRSLSIRSNDDPAIAMLDSWALVADVLTFYQERIANEGYLRTATERRSILELARAIGYELRPGVAASTYLAFTVEQSQIAQPTGLGTPKSGQPSSGDIQGAAQLVTVPKGTKVQSVPAQGKTPQTFETIETITAKAKWNILKPRQMQPQKLGIDANQGLRFIGLDGSNMPAKQLFLTGTSTNLKQGDLLLATVRATSGEFWTALTVRVQSVTVDADQNLTRVDFEELQDGVQVPPFVAHQNLDGTVTVDPVAFNEENVIRYVLNKDWHDADLAAFIDIQHWSAEDLTKVIAEEDVNPPASLQRVFVLRQKASFFGHNAPYYQSLPQDIKSGSFNWDHSSGWQIWLDPRSNKYYSTEGLADVFLDRAVPEIVAGSWVVFERPTNRYRVYMVKDVIEASLAEFALSGKATGLSLKNSNGTEPPRKSSRFKVRKTAAYVQSESLDLAQLPILESISSGTTELMLDRMVLGLRKGQHLILSGEDNSSPGISRTEALTIEEITHSGGFSTLAFQKSLQYSYVRKTVTLNANVALSTHGETVHEVLGSGDAAQANQTFALRRPPLTYTAAATPSGGQSSLQGSVNDVIWDELPRLYGIDGHTHGYIIRIDNDGRPNIIFGDGGRGSRLPSGSQNVVANYRSGIGPDGEVDAGTLTILQTRPLGIREATNPLPATGAEAPETLNKARVSAPLTLMTFDRIVSLEDYEDFARSFAGIGKAQATALWVGETRLVHLTIGAADGGQVTESSQLFINLAKAIREERDPVQQTRVESYQPLSFNLSANIIVDPKVTTPVLDSVKETLKAAFSFEKRGFAQPVTAAEVMATIQRVPGVVALNIKELYLATDPAGFQETLQSLCARWDDQAKDFKPAQLLLINPVGVTLTETNP